MSRTSSALSSFLMKPPVQSKVSRTKSSPGSTQQAIGMSGCHRLWMFSFSTGDFVRSTLISVSVMGRLQRFRGWEDEGGSDGEVLPDVRHVGGGARRLVHQPPALDDEQPVGDVQREAEHLLGDDDRDLAQLADLVQRPGDVLDDGR